MNVPKLPPKLTQPAPRDVLSRIFRTLPEPARDIPPVEEWDDTPQIFAEYGLFELLYAKMWRGLEAAVIQRIDMDPKPVTSSKTFWANLLALAWTFIGPAVGIPVLDPETTVAILGVINLILRLITKQPVGLS